jgi:hypothetical protein
MFEKRISRKVRDVAYLRAVRLSLELLFQIDPGKSEDIALTWWSRLAQTPAIKSGIYLHVEPLQTAADLLGVKRPVMNDADRQRYSKILSDSLRLAKTPTKPPGKVSLPFDEEMDREHTRKGRLLKFGV